MSRAPHKIKPRVFYMQDVAKWFVFCILKTLIISIEFFKEKTNIKIWSSQTTAKVQKICKLNHHLSLFLVPFLFLTLRCLALPYLVLTWYIKKYDMHKYNFINNNEPYRNISTWSHTERQWWRSRKKMKMKKTKITSKGKDVHSGGRCPHHHHHLCGECIETKLTDIFHSINDFTIQLKVQHLWNCCCSVLFFCAPLLSAECPLSLECWVHSS